MPAIAALKFRAEISPARRRRAEFGSVGIEKSAHLAMVRRGAEEVKRVLPTRGTGRKRVVYTRGAQGFWPEARVASGSAATQDAARAA